MAPPRRTSPPARRAATHRGRPPRRRHWGVEALESRFLLASPGSLLDEVRAFAPAGAIVGGLLARTPRGLDRLSAIDRSAIGLIGDAGDLPAPAGDGAEGVDPSIVPVPFPGFASPPDFATEPAWEVDLLDGDAEAGPTAPWADRLVLDEDVDAPFGPGSAPVLGWAEYLELHAHLGPGDASDLFAVPIDATTGQLRVSFRMTGPRGDLRERVVVLDERGRVLEDRPMGRQSGQVILDIGDNLPVTIHRISQKRIFQCRFFHGMHFSRGQQSFVIFFNIRCGIGFYGRFFCHAAL